MTVVIEIGKETGTHTAKSVNSQSGFSVLSLFTGAGGLDLGFERAGFRHLTAVEIDPWCFETLGRNRPDWRVTHGDVRKYEPDFSEVPDVLLAGFPCQGFSLGGNRDEEDERNLLYKEVIRIAKLVEPKIILLENVLNLRTMYFPGTQKPFAEQIADELRSIGYDVTYDVFRVSKFGVPQTRRRFVFVAFRGNPPAGYHFPHPGAETPIRPVLYDLAQDSSIILPNHNPAWGFRSAVHTESAEPYSPSEIVVPVRLSRTASDGNPIRSFDEPFPAVDTATVWGWAQGNVKAQRVMKDRAREKYIRNPEANVTLWRVSASRLRSFTHREYARLQTFPDDWIFHGDSKRDVQLQIGNAVPVRFSECLAQNLRRALEALDLGSEFRDERPNGVQRKLF